MSKPFACVVAYPSTTSDGSKTTFDMSYYLATHMTMIDKYWGPHGMKSWSIAQFGPGLDGAQPPYIVQTTIYWDSLDQLKSALEDPKSKETGEDVAKFSNVYPAIWLSNVTGTNTLA